MLGLPNCPIEWNFHPPRSIQITRVTGIFICQITISEKLRIEHKLSSTAMMTKLTQRIGIVKARQLKNIIKDDYFARSEVVHEGATSLL